MNNLKYEKFHDAITSDISSNKYSTHTLSGLKYHIIHLISIFFTTQSFCKVKQISRKKFYFVDNKNSIVKKIVDKDNKHFSLLLKGGVKNFISFNPSLFFLDLYYDALYRWKRQGSGLYKIILNLFYKPILKRNIQNIVGLNLVVSQDYQGAPYVLKFLNPHLSFQLIGFQHGLLNLNPNHVDLFPCSSLRKNIIFHACLKKSMRKISHSRLYGPKSFHCKNEIQDSTKSNEVVFISSGHIEFCYNYLAVFKKIFNELNILFTIRLHPHESRFKNKIRDNLNINIDSNKETLLNKKHNIVFMGIYSTLLFEAAISGFKVVFIPPCEDLIEDGGFKLQKDELDMINKLPNTELLDNINSESFMEILRKPLYRYNSDSYIQDLSSFFFKVIQND